MDTGEVAGNAMDALDGGLYWGGILMQSIYDATYVFLRHLGPLASVVALGMFLSIFFVVARRPMKQAWLSGSAFVLYVVLMASLLAWKFGDVKGTAAVASSEGMSLGVLTRMSDAVLLFVLILVILAATIAMAWHHTYGALLQVAVFLGTLCFQWLTGWEPTNIVATLLLVFALLLAYVGSLLLVQKGGAVA